MKIPLETRSASEGVRFGLAIMADPFARASGYKSQIPRRAGATSQLTLGACDTFLR